MQQQQPRKSTLSLDRKTEFPNLTASNSFVAEGMIFYCEKEDTVYVCWEYKSRYKIASFATKDVAKEWIYKNIKKIKVRIDEQR